MVGFPARGGVSRPEKVRLPDQRTVWREMATLLDGELVEGKRQTADKIVVRHGPWRIVADIYVQSNGQAAVMYTRVRACFAGWRGLKVVVRRRNVFDRLWEALGFGERPHVDPGFQERYVVKGKPEGRVPSLFAGQAIFEAIASAESVRLEVKRPGRKDRKVYGEEAGEVVARTTGVVRDLGRLAGLIRTVAETLEALQRVGEAGAEELRGA